MKKMIHIRKHKSFPARTSRNWAIHHHLIPEAETLCGSSVTDKDCRISDVIKNGKLTKFGLVWTDWNGCPDCFMEAKRGTPCEK